MFSELEQKVINEHKEWGFGAYLQHIWFYYPPPEKHGQWQTGIEKGNFPTQQELMEDNALMIGKRQNFDICYFISLPAAPVNPLRVEQEAWKLLSPRVQQYTDEFGAYIQGYSPQAAEKEPLLAHLNKGWDLLQQWNVISNSYKAKYEGTTYGKKYDEDLRRVEENEAKAKALIEELSSRPR